MIKTEFAGEVTVQWSAIQEIKSEGALHVGLNNGQTVVGPVTARDGKLEVATKAAGNVEAAKENVAAIRNDAERLAYDKAQHPGLLQGWNVRRRIWPWPSTARARACTTNSVCTPDRSTRPTTCLRLLLT